MRISVVVATFNRARVLGRCLRALIAQDLPAADYEIIVVDNNSTDGTRAVVETAIAEAREHSIRYLFELRQGVSAARNAGLRAVSAPVLAFTDDDVVVPPGWLSALLARIETLPSEAAGVGGEIEPAWEAPPPEWLDENFYGFLSARVSNDQTPRWITDEDWLIECNIAYRRELLLSVGGMPESLDRMGETLLSGGQVVNRVLTATGHPIYYDPGITVRHDVPAERMTLAWMKRRAFWQGVTHFQQIGYLRGWGIEEPFRPLVLPQEGGWRSMLGPVSDRAGFVEAMYRCQNLGYAVAVMGVLQGR